MEQTIDTSRRKRLAAHRRKPCFMAYTLNNTQPVICTLVADQPYLYMDEATAPEYYILGLESYEDFERDLADLKKKIDAFERKATSYERDPQRRIEEFAAEAITICEAAAQPQSYRLDALTELLSHSRMAQSLLDFAGTHGVAVLASDQVDGARYDKSAGKIFVHTGLDVNEQALLAVRELRRHWQHRQGALLHPLTFHPDQAIVINRAQIADLTASMIRAAWEIQLSGRRDIWDYLENSAMADLARTFAREAFVDFRSIASGKAASAVFESWFLSERSRHQDKKLIQAMLADHQGYVFSDSAVSRTVTLELIAALGEQPFGKNYLAPHARTIIEDPIFTEVRDRSNANFLWFIKFERSFRETEQALQDGEASFGPDIPSPPVSHRQGRFDHDAESVVIPLTFKPRDVSSGGSGRAGSGSVVHVRFGD